MSREFRVLCPVCTELATGVDPIIRMSPDVEIAEGIVAKQADEITGAILAPCGHKVRQVFWRAISDDDILWGAR